MVQRIGCKLHRTGNNNFCRDSVEHLPILENNKSSHICHYLPLPELLAHVNLNVRQPHLGHKISGAHEGAGGSPPRGGLVDDDPRLLPHQVHVQLEGDGEGHVVNL